MLPVSVSTSQGGRLKRTATAGDDRRGARDGRNRQVPAAKHPGQHGDALSEGRHRIRRLRVGSGGPRRGCAVRTASGAGIARGQEGESRTDRRRSSPAAEAGRRPGGHARLLRRVSRRGPVPRRGRRRGPEGLSEAQIPAPTIRRRHRDVECGRRLRGGLPRRPLSGRAGRVQRRDRRQSRCACNRTGLRVRPDGHTRSRASTPAVDDAGIRRERGVRVRPILRESRPDAIPTIPESCRDHVLVRTAHV